MIGRLRTKLIFLELEPRRLIFDLCAGCVRQLITVSSFNTAGYYLAWQHPGHPAVRTHGSFT